MPKSHCESISKSDIINRLIEQFGFASFLEYNKFEGESYFQEVVCESKELAYIPEQSYLDATNIKRLLNIISDTNLNKILDLEQLQIHYAERKFDIIFFDPVHVRPEVDRALQILPTLLNPGGILVVHDCNPENFSLTTVDRRPGEWMGETYKAFAIFRYFNRAQTQTISEDFGVGLIWNTNLNLSYSYEYDINYQDFEKNRTEYVGLLKYDDFLLKTNEGKVDSLFMQESRKHPIRLFEKTFKFSVEVDNSKRLVDRKKFEAQLFWRCVGLPYAEERSQIQYWDEHKENQVLRFQIPPLLSPLLELRFDFSNEICSACLKQLSLCNSSGQTVSTWNSPAKILHRIRNLKALEDDFEDSVLYLCATTKDPHFSFLLSEHELRIIGSEGAIFEVHLSPLSTPIHELLSLIPVDENVGHVSQTYSNVFKEILFLQRRNATLETHLSEFDRLLISWRRSLQ